mmetsp:Transcript_39930/g.79947  ORF Transcript_39930/g.79947 Transcript_39930/m.79947 type:complete len:370 (-) Transcript_39930:214-1323(-)|eukprot:CAMPEP_0174694600 /NCGR_PEP_ID=MMETSP1094-20130205/1151_1 /TAXON_ID=156173 /ORGANISM="Chrysochromulina brevifilum, Strain UTEX LB 985" /LENGTH=369 /DNA_ID=CAMNT_0015890879 /DNA_START=364 /DNA_END=1473 /DNA_ORIENTATION=-
MPASSVLFQPPTWARHLIAPKHGRVPFAHLPTPVMPWACSELAEFGVEWFIKRDDMTGIEMSGNKARKLEFLMAEALATECDSVCTIGGLQSNHCRATAAAARLVGLEPHIVLVVPGKDADKDVGFQGNLMLDRLLGAKLHIASGNDYVRLGGDLAAMENLNACAVDELRRQGRRPYTVPVGGTTPVGTWGYLNAVEELRLQQEQQLAPQFDHIVCACGSGGTTTGLALGLRLAGFDSALHAVNVQHSPDTYYELIDQEATMMGATTADGSAREWLSIHDGGQLGYGHTNREQLECIVRTGAASGVVLDHVYSGKALAVFCDHVRKHPDEFRGKKILFWHTGGLPGLQAAEKQLRELIPPVERLHVPFE